MQVLYVCVGISMYLQVFLNQYNIHTYSNWHIPAHSDIPAHSYRYCMSLCCRYFFQIPTDMPPTFWHTHTYLPTGFLMSDCPSDCLTSQLFSSLYLRYWLGVNSQHSSSVSLPQHFHWLACHHDWKVIVGTWFSATGFGHCAKAWWWFFEAGCLRLLG